MRDSSWVLYDDDQIREKGAWDNVVEMCVEFQCYPTVLFFERLTDADSQKDMAMKLSQHAITDMFNYVK